MLPLPCGNSPHGIDGSYDVHLGLYQGSLVIAILSPWESGRISSNLPQLTLELLLARWTDREGEPVSISVLLTWVLRFPRRLHELSPLCVFVLACVRRVLRVPHPLLPHVRQSVKIGPPKRLSPASFGIRARLPRI